MMLPPSTFALAPLKPLTALADATVGQVSSGTGGNLLNTIGIAILTLIAMAAAVPALAELIAKNRSDEQRKSAHRRQGIALWIIMFGAGALFTDRWITRGDWQPVEAHVDGLLLIATFFAATLLFLQHRTRVPGLTALGLPVLAVVLAWSFCASRWTFEPFRIGSVWMTVHLASVYLGFISLAIAGVAGGLFLVAQKRLRSKRDIAAEPSMASLETIETLIIRTSTCGFALITLGLVTGGVLLTSGPTRMGPGWWHSPKVALSVAVWLLYAIVMNVRHASLFRGARAAYLSIIGVVLLLATFVVVLKLPPLPKPATLTPSPLEGEGGGEGYRTKTDRTLRETSHIQLSQRADQRSRFSLATPHPSPLPQRERGPDAGGPH